MDPEAFRKEAHRIADWIADYFAAPERYPVLSRRSQPGDIRDALPALGARAAANRSTRSSRTSSASCCPASRTGTIPASSPTSPSPAARPGVLAEFLSAALNVQAMLWRTSPAATELEEVALGWLRQLIGLPDTFEGVIYDTASISTLHALAAARELTVADVRDARPRGPIRSAAAARLLLRARALVGRQGGHPARSRPRRRCGASKPTHEFRMRPEALAAAIDEDTRRGRAADRGRRDGRHDLDDERRSGRRDRRRSARANASGCTSTPRTPASRRWFRSTAGSCATRPRADSRRRQSAQVAVHAVRSERAVLPPHGRRAGGVLADARVSEDRREPATSGT